MLLPAYPLCFEWLNYDHESESENVNYIAIGDMNKDILVWDIDVVDSLEPVAKLVGHEDSVLDLSWNKTLRKTISSGSADKSVCVWDLDTGSAITRFSHFNTNVQSVKFHPFEAQTLLVGDCDGCTSIIDCQSGGIKKWKVENTEIEKVIWNHYNPYTFYASTSNGFVYCYDCRKDKKFIYSIKAHDETVTGLVLR